MITADKVRTYGNLTVEALTGMIKQTYPKDSFLTARFLGITNGHEFCYAVTYTDPEFEHPQEIKVFVDINGEADY